MGGNGKTKSQAGDGTRTRDPLFTRQALYQLSYSGKATESRDKWGRSDDHFPVHVLILFREIASPDSHYPGPR
jgi:hypothetical protein